MPSVEVNARFKNCNIKDKKILQFELSGSSVNLLPELSTLANTDVILTIEGAQAELPIEAEYEAEPAEDQEPIPFEGDEPFEYDDAMALPEAEEE